MTSAILETLPLYLQNCLEFQWLMYAVEQQVDKYDEYIDIEELNLIVDTMDETTVSRWEKILRITPKATDTMENRKFRIKTWWLERVPFTYRKMLSMLDLMLGEGTYRTELDTVALTLAVEIEKVARADFVSIEKMLERMVPANVGMRVQMIHDMEQTAYISGVTSVFTITELPEVEEEFNSEQNIYASGAGTVITNTTIPEYEYSTECTKNVEFSIGSGMITTTVLDES